MDNFKQVSWAIFSIVSDLIVITFALGVFTNILAVNKGKNWESFVNFF